MRMFVVAGAMMLASMAQAATYCHWTGGAHDGIWSTPENWQEGHMPGMEDYVIIDCGTGLEIAISAPTTIGKFQPYGSGTLTINGEKLSVLLASDGAFSNSCAVVMNAPLGLAGSSGKYSQNFIAMAPLTVNAPVTMIEPKAGTTVAKLQIVCADVANAQIVFNDTVSTFVNETIGCRPLIVDGIGDNSIVFRKKVTAHSIGSTYKTPAGGGMKFYGPLELTTYEYGINYRTSHTCAPGVLNDTIYLNWKDNYRGGRLYLDGINQTVDYLTGTYLDGSTKPSDDPAKPGRALCSDDPATLTIRASQSAETPVYVSGKVSLVYDAKDKDFVQTFAYRPSPTEGAITVKKGTFKLDKGASFSNVVQVTVLADGIFEIGSANGVATPLASLETLDIAAGGKLKVPAGVSVSSAMVRIGGRWQTAGDYTQATADWIEGGGTVTAQPVASGPTRWCGPNTGSSAWNVAANWLRGLPSSALPALIDEPASGDAGYELIVSQDANLYELTIEAPGAGPAKVSAQAALTLAGSTVTLGTNGVLSADSSGIVEIGTDEIVTVQPGGTLAATAGSIQMKAQGAVKLRGGSVSLSGSGVWNDSVAKNHSLFAGYGTVLFSGQSKFLQSAEVVNPRFYLSQDADSIVQGPLSVVFRDDSELTSETIIDTFNVSYVAGGDVRLVLEDRAAASVGRNLNVGYAAGSTGVVEIADSAVLSLSHYGLTLAMDTGTLGVLRMTGGLLDNSVQASGGQTSLNGIVVGEGDNSSAQTMAYDRKGAIEISGGIISNRVANAFMTVGVGTAEGTVFQGGGFVSLRGNSLARQGGLTLGLRGGRGSYSMSAGRFENKMQTYVGGTELSRLNYKGTRWSTDRGGFGSFVISGGTYEEENDFFVSLAGRGEVEVSGGQIAIGGNLALTNSVDALTGGDYAATLTFKVNADGTCGTVTVGGAVDVAAGSEIVIDMTDAPDSVERLRLLSAGEGIRGANAGTNVRMVGSSDQYKLVLTESSLGVSKVRGMILFVR